MEAEPMMKIDEARAALATAITEHKKANAALERLDAAIDGAEHRKDDLAAEVERYADLDEKLANAAASALMKDTDVLTIPAKLAEREKERAYLLEQARIVTRGLAQLEVRRAEGYKLTVEKLRAVDIASGRVTAAYGETLTAEMVKHASEAMRMFEELMAINRSVQLMQAPALGQISQQALQRLGFLRRDMQMNSLEEREAANRIEAWRVARLALMKDSMAPLPEAA
jgi:hypothetical protein